MSSAAAKDQIANVDVFLILTDHRDRVLLGLRARHLYAGGYWNLVSGKADTGEDVTTAVVREAAEEAGISLQPGDVSPASVVYYRNADGRPRVGFGFRARHRPDVHGPTVNAEPHKCDGLAWYQPSALPQPLEPYSAAILAAADGPARFVLAGWPDPPALRTL